MKNKGKIFFVTVLLILSSTAGIIGYKENKKGNENINNEPKKASVIYNYFLEGLQTNEIPTNEVEIDESGNETINKMYEIEKYSCTNNLTGNFDEDAWTFIPDRNDIDSTCSLYFLKTKYEVTLTISNGIEDESNNKYVEREKNGVFKIIPNEGYIFNGNYLCSDEKDAQWNENENTLTINAVTKDIACKVIFEIKNLKMDVTVINGNGNTTENVNYGEKVEAIVNPKDGYEKPKIECTNNQTAIFKDSKITIEKLTDNTSCKVTFNPVPIEKYNLTIKNLPENIKIVTGDTTQSIEKGKTATITLKADEGYEINSISCEGVTPSKEVLDNGSIKYTFLSIEKNVTCEIESKAKEKND